MTDAPPSTGSPDASGAPGTGPPLQPSAAPPPHRPGVVREYFEAALVAAVIFLFLNAFALQHSKIPSGSMEKTLLPGDHILVNKYVFAPSPAWGFLPGREPHRGDVVVFKFPRPPHQDFIKRVIGLPGDRIRLRGSQVYVNDVPIEEPYLDRDPRPLHMRGQVHFVEMEIPPGEYFVLGDNRQESNDSRYWGTVPRGLIRGRAVCVLFSLRPLRPPPEGESGGSRMSRLLWHLRTGAARLDHGRFFKPIR